MTGVLLETMQNHARRSTLQDDAIDNDILHRIQKARDVDGEPLSADVVLVSVAPMTTVVSYELCFRDFMDEFFDFRLNFKSL